MGHVIIYALLTAAALSFHYLLLSHFGRDAYNYSPDWAHHLALTRILTDYGNPLFHGPQLGEFARFPRYAHIATGIISRAYQLSPFVALQLIANAMAIVASVLVSARVCLSVAAWIAGRPEAPVPTGRRRWIGALAALAVAAAVLSGARALGFSPDGQVQWNFFYSQAVGTTLAILFFIPVQACRAAGDRTALLAGLASVPATYLLACFHTVPALWFGAASAVAMLAPYRRPAAALPPFLAVAALNAGAVLLAPGTRETLRIMRTSEGVGGVMTGPLLNTNLAAQTAWIYAGIALIAAVLALLAWLSYSRGGTRRLADELCGRNAGLVALLGIALLLLVKLRFDGATELYPLSKYVYFLAADLAVGLACLTCLAVESTTPASERAAPSRRSGAWRLPAPVASSAFAAATLAGLSFAQYHGVLFYAVDQSEVIGLDRDLRRVFPDRSAPILYPQFPFLTGAENYLLAISALGYPRYPDATPLFETLPLRTDLDDLPAPVPPRLAPSHYDLWTGEPVDLTDRRSRTVLVRGAPQPDTAEGEPPATGNGAEFLFGLAPTLDRRLSVCLALLAPADAGGERRGVTVSAGSERVASAEFSSGRDSATVAIPLAFLGQDVGDVRLRLLNLDASGRRRPAGTHGARLLSMWIAEGCADSRTE